MWRLVKKFHNFAEAGGQIPPIPSGIPPVQSGIQREILELPTWYPTKIFGWDPVNPIYNSGWDTTLIFRWDAVCAS